MIVYHGSTQIIKKPDIEHSKNYLDFGKGFYLTTYEHQEKQLICILGVYGQKKRC